MGADGFQGYLLGRLRDDMMNQVYRVKSLVEWGSLAFYHKLLSTNTME